MSIMSIIINKQKGCIIYHKFIVNTKSATKYLCFYLDASISVGFGRKDCPAHIRISLEHEKQKNKKSKNNNFKVIKWLF